MKFRIVATVLLLIVCAIGYILVGNNNAVPAAPQSAPQPSADDEAMKNMKL